MGVKRVFEQRASEDLERYDWFTEAVREETEAFEVRLKYAKTLVSLWSYASYADGKLQSSQAHLVGEMTRVLFDEGCVLSDYIEQKDEIIDILSSTFETPLTIKSIAKFVEGNDEMAANFYEDACCIIGANKKITNDEKEFLNSLASELKITDMDKKTRERKFDLKI